MEKIFFKTLMLKGEAGGTITSIEKIEAQGGVMFMRMHLSDGSTIDFEVNDIPDTDLINNLIDVKLDPVKATVDQIEELTEVFDVDLLPTNWNGTGPGYSITVSKAGITSNQEFEIVGFIPPNSDIEANAEIKKNLAYIIYGESGTDSLTFYAYNNKPTVPLNLRIRKVSV